jgi:hypothetical protein
VVPKPPCSRRNGWGGVETTSLTSKTGDGVETTPFASKRENSGIVVSRRKYEGKRSRRTFGARDFISSRPPCLVCHLVFSIGDGGWKVGGWKVGC